MKTGSFWLGVLAGLVPAAYVEAGIPLPDAVTFGDVCIDGQAPTVPDPGDPNAVRTRVMACIGCDSSFVGPAIGAYTIGDNAFAGNQYVLRMRLEQPVSGQPVGEGAAAIGDTAHVYVQVGDAPPVRVATYLIHDMGVVERLDLSDGSQCIAVPVATFPPDGAIDARYPSQPDGSGPTGWQSVEFLFQGVAEGLQPADFSIACTGGTCPDISSVSAVASAATLELSTFIPLGQRTVITHTASGMRICLGYLPADVSGDGAAVATDILDLIDSLNGWLPTPLETWQCDIDRSGVCNGTDILGIIDLLNGAGAFDPWINRRLPDCPAP